MSRTEHPTLADARAKLLDYINRHLTLRGFSTSSRALHEFLAVFEAGVRDDEREILRQPRVVSAPADVSFVPSVPGEQPWSGAETIHSGDAVALKNGELVVLADNLAPAEFVAPPLGVTIGVDLGAPEVSSAPFEDSLHIQSLIDDGRVTFGAERFIAPPLASSKADDDQTGAALVAPKLNVLEKSRVVVDSK